MEFFGGPVLALDAKGRVTVPSDWRAPLLADEETKGRLVVTKDPAGCLRVVPRPTWLAFAAKMRALPAEAAPWRRFFLGESVEIEIDSGDRILIPQQLREWAGLGKEVKFMGVGAYFELWDRTRQAADEAKNMAAGMPDCVQQLVDA